MKIAVIGTGYVGLVAGICFADSGQDVICVDKDQKKIDLLRRGEIPIYEPGLDDLLRTANPRIQFTTDLASAVKNSSVLFIAVGTPEKPDGSADTGPTFEAIREICRVVDAPKTLVLKSTVPIGTAREAMAMIRELSRHQIDVVSNPEFLKEGAAVDDFLRPDRVIIGVLEGDGRSAPANVMREIYDPFLRSGPMLIMDHTAAEMTKYAANSFLSVKISFINELALLCDRVGCDIDDVRKGFTSDKRINPAFFNPGVGYGGSCFPKDVKALVYTGEKNGIPMHVVNSADQVNKRQKTVLFDKMKAHFGTLKGKTIAVWGLAFKPRTDDVREAPALELIERLLEAGAKVRAYDPIANETALALAAKKFETAPSADAAAEGADAVAIVTEWNEFRTPRFELLKSTMRSPVIFDGRNVLDPKKVREEGFTYFCIGRESVGQPGRVK